MKKVFAILLCLSMIVLCSCGNGVENIVGNEEAATKYQENLLNILNKEYVNAIEYVRVLTVDDTDRASIGVSLCEPLDTDLFDEVIYTVWSSVVSSGFFDNGRITLNIFLNANGKISSKFSTSDYSEGLIVGFADNSVRYVSIDVENECLVDVET